jgi:hypothetical protein
MGNLATRRLIEAAAALEPADRALLNLWIHRGLDDERLAGLTGMSVVAVQARRERILAGLSERLGEPPEDVLMALRSLEPGAGAADQTAAAAGGGGRPDVTATAGGLDTPATVSTAGLPEPSAMQPKSSGDPQVEPNIDPRVEPESRVEKAEAEPEGGPSPAPPAPGAPDAPGASGGSDTPDTPGAPRRRGRVWAGLTAGIAVVVAVLLVVLLAGGSSHNASDPIPSASATDVGSPTAPPARATTPATSSSASASSSTTATTSGTASTPAPRSPSGPHPLAGLPGGLRHVSGVVRLVGKVGHLKLRLTVKGLPLVHHGYYAAWLFNSVLDSQRLGRVTRDLPNTYPLPPGARRFHFVDISFQPKGTVNHSGESKLRAINPVDGPKTIIHTARARTPRRLTRASAVRHHSAKNHHQAHKQTARRSARQRHATRHGHHRSHHRRARRPDAAHRRHGAHRRHATHRRRGSRSSKASTS